MSFDRWGNRILLGWADHELLWIKAALELDRPEQPHAFQQIAEMSHRPYTSIRDKAYAMRREVRIELERSYTRRVMVPARALPKTPEAISRPPSQINTSATMAAKRMGAR